MADKSYWTYKRFLNRIKRTHGRLVYDKKLGRYLKTSEYPELHEKFKRSKKDIGEFLAQYRAPSVRKQKVKSKRKLTKKQLERIKALRKTSRRNPSGLSKEQALLAGALLGAFLRYR